MQYEATFMDSECPSTITEPCPVCGNLPCTCEGQGGGKNKVVVRLSKLRSLSLKTDLTEHVQFGDELISIEEYIKRLFGTLQKLLDGEEELRERWARPETRQQLLNLLEKSGFQEDKLNLMLRLLNMENCDILDVLSYLAYNTITIGRKRRADILRANLESKVANVPEYMFADFILDMYVNNGYKELSLDNLPILLNMKFHSLSDAKKYLGKNPVQIMNFFVKLQHDLYTIPA